MSSHEIDADCLCSERRSDGRLSALQSVYQASQWHGVGLWLSGHEGAAGQRSVSVVSGTAACGVGEPSGETRAAHHQFSCGEGRCHAISLEYNNTKQKAAPSSDENEYYEMSIDLMVVDRAMHTCRVFLAISDNSDHSAIEPAAYPASRVLASAPSLSSTSRYS